MNPRLLHTLLVIPVYNHGPKLRSVLERALNAGWPVLVVDDGSTDRGPDLITDLPCRLHRLPHNQGKGSAILTGARLAAQWGYDTIVTVDADGQLDPEDAARLVETATAQERPAIVVGTRLMTRDTAPGASLFGRAFSNFWVRLECGLDLPDTQSGLRLYPVEFLLHLPVRARRYDFEVEVLVRAAWAGIPILSTPVRVHYPSEGKRISHFHQWKDNLRLTLLHTRLILRALNPWPHRRLAGRATSSVMDMSLFHPIRLFKQLCREHSTPAQLGIAAWMGLFLGALPLIACHTIVIVYVTHRLHLNKPAAVAASQLCCPPVVPVICIEAGYFMRNGHLLLELSLDTTVYQLHQRLLEWLLGSLIVGPSLGLAGGLATYFVVRWLRTMGARECDS
jgi:glycosyltransferase involved in cell wall biosynthesis